MVRGRRVSSASRLATSWVISPIRLASASTSSAPIPPLEMIDFVVVKGDVGWKARLERKRPFELETPVTH